MPTPAPLICVLDDDARVLRSIECLLDSEGLIARTFEDAAEFLAHARAEAVAVAVLDVCLAEMNGIEVQALLRGFSPGTRVIIMTGRDDAGIKAAALRNGARAFLLKPFGDEEFLAHVRNALARKG